jgi:conjugal transfer pilus assembly protein TraV
MKPVVKTRAMALSLGAMLVLCGCVSMSGLDAKSNFACKVPDGIFCESMSGIYANAQANDLPGQRMDQRAKTDPLIALSQAKGVMTKPLYSGTPIRSAPRLLRVWFSPWEDSDGDLHDQSYVYLQVDSGRWLIEHNQRRIQDAYRPVRAPASATMSQSPGAAQDCQACQDQQYGQAAVQGGEAEEVVIGVRQDRMSDAQAAQFLDGVLTPGDVAPQAK